ncbi:MAG TPA: hypothetical protein VMZ91_12860 [Candidatus Paceibacterota bacterium]|nr:hypothetical protein [Candidatus Paceibacterota bacterium]
MCGIFGVLVNKKSKVETNFFKSLTDSLFKISESRGKEAAGFALLSGNAIKIYKQPGPASVLIRGKKYKEVFYNLNVKDSAKDKTSIYPLGIIGHTRLVTKGALEINQNNQPVIRDGLVGVHNGIIVNVEKLWKDFSDLERKYEVDTEIILALIRMFLKEKKSLTEAVINTFGLIKGSVSIALLFNNINGLLLATNTGSLYFYLNKGEDFLIFASELDILKRVLKRHGLEKSDSRIYHIEPGTGYFVDLDDLKTKKFLFYEKEDFEPEKNLASFYLDIIDLSDYNKNNLFSGENNRADSELKITPTFSFPGPNQLNLKRCTRCILPETMPFIEFDDKGVCNYCRSYKKIELKDKSILEEIIRKHRNTSDKRPDCLVAFSGGRDSSYGLHYIKKVLKMNPIAYSYDWGMITDLGRRNQARLCGELGIEHIIVSGDIRRKREYIRKNVLAWLKKPDLGMVPLFMAGDKQYFYYANKIMRKTETKMIIMCENPLERTHFKHGFCGIKHKSADIPPYFFSLLDKIKIAAYYAKQFITNPSYLQSSVVDTLTGYISYYLIPHNYLYLYDFIGWGEEKILSTLRNEYDWETANDTKTTWRIGDGTVAFYNYIYYAIAGFTENDTFRSNQIREGIITREEALKLIEEDNKPRYESIKWYCETIGIDFEETLKTINSAPKLYYL